MSTSTTVPAVIENVERAIETYPAEDLQVIATYTQGGEDHVVRGIAEARAVLRLDLGGTYKTNRLAPVARVERPAGMHPGESLALVSADDVIKALETARSEQAIAVRSALVTAAMQSKVNAAVAQRGSDLTPGPAAEAVAEAVGRIDESIVALDIADDKAMREMMDRAQRRRVLMEARSSITEYQAEAIKNADAILTERRRAVRNSASAIAAMAGRQQAIEQAAAEMPAQSWTMRKAAATIGTTPALCWEALGEAGLAIKTSYVNDAGRIIDYATWYPTPDGIKAGITRRGVQIVGPDHKEAPAPAMLTRTGLATLLDALDRLGSGKPMAQRQGVLARIREREIQQGVDSLIRQMEGSYVDDEYDPALTADLLITKAIDGRLDDEIVSMQGVAINA